MCGIAGKVSVRAGVERALIESMCSTIEHRGPDSHGAFIEDGVGLGVQRLAVIDLGTGDQPIASEDGNVVVVQNGEIYNYRELRTELEGRGHAFRTQGDTEVVVHLYEEYGGNCVDHLRGMFAFALWDRTRRRLLLARDRLGKKPLFYSAGRGTLWFGSETKAILRDPEVPRDVDHTAIDCYLHYQYVPDPMSAFAALRKLPPGHVLTWDGGEPQVRRYWDVSYADKLDLPEAELQELIRDELVEATRLRLRSDVPLGALLSGGVDSSAVVAAMAQTAPGRVKTFSIGFGHGDFDESGHALRVAELFDTDHHRLEVGPDAIASLADLVWHYGEPFADHSAIPSFAVSELTRRHVTVALNGDGGDESFGGYDRYVLAGRSHRLDRIPRAAWRAGAGAFGTAAGSPTGSSRAARAARAAAMMALPRAQRYAEYVAYFKTRQRKALYRPEFAASIDVGVAPAVVGGPYDASDAEDEIERLIDVDMHTYLPGDLLVKMDIASMAHSLEVRSPLLDQRLVEFAARLPRRTKISDDGRTKRLFKDALRVWLPDEILDRPKMGFSVPLRDWLAGPLRELPREVLLDPVATGRGMFEEREVRRLIDEHVAGKAANENRLWALIQLELWFRTYIDSHEAGPIAFEAPVLAV
jgi:asparagine synthase (glutamine-hydrolysing)